MPEVLQVDDDAVLLRTMLDDLRDAPPLFRPTNYWAVYAQRFVPELREHGLRDFRRRRGSVLASFGASDPRPLGAYVDLGQSRLFANRFTRHLPGWDRLLDALNRLLNRPGNSPVALDVYECELSDLQQTAFRLTELAGERAGARALEAFVPSLVGNPDDVFEIDGKHYTMRSLYYYLRYAYCCRFTDFDRTSVIVELGPGAGRQIEVIRKLHPHICVFAFDIAPQLYVCQQFLSTIFPGAVVSYMETRTYDRLPPPRPGAIFICGTASFPLIERVRVDLFWNAVSFQEMEPEVVANYLRYVDRSADAVYLQQIMEGKRVAARSGEAGVLRQTTIDDYRRGLPSFELVDRSACLRPLGTLHRHEDSFWRRVRPAA